MPSLTNKLKSLGVQLGADKIKAPGKPTAFPCLLDIFNGSWENTSSGDCFVIRKTFHPDYVQGNTSLFNDLDLNILEGDPSLVGISSIPLDQFLFIDTETTGLAGGAGTYVFLIGAAKYKNGKFHFAQFFLQDPAAEPAQLAALEKFCINTKVIISYNGKSFDLPRIKTRYKFNGWPPPFEDVYHLDLLHVARRLWKSHLSSCSLGDIEHHLLGKTRSSLDIPGWKVASVFFDYLSSGDPTPLSSVFYHNEEDVISLIAFLKYIIDRLSNPLSKKYLANDDLVSIGIYLATQKQNDSGKLVLSHVIENIDLPDHLHNSALIQLASLYKKTGDYSKAVPLWEIIASRDFIQAHTELAMYYEHKRFDYQEAIHWSLSAVEVITKQSKSETRENTLQAFDHRLSRLKRKLSRFNR